MKNRIICAAAVLLAALTVILAVNYITKHETKPDRGVLHLGLNAEITGIDADRQRLCVRGTDANSTPYFGEGCWVDCGRAVETFKVIYVDYSKKTVDNLIDISLDELLIGDNIIIGAYENELNCPENGVISVEQIQLDTQRMDCGPSKETAARAELARVLADSFKAYANIEDAAVDTRYDPVVAQIMVSPGGGLSKEQKESIEKLVSEAFPDCRIEYYTTGA